ncbi:DUF4189 domain-containing protein [Eikenella sp. S3360]|uniref:DUF4189 domain-containing protein n=1 Tax=Eikenella glucosivorans TaxID=2766967 RepID=A0ABS0NC15_9NEIS|nr:DUF4189 domain-containing protein [Eikenella glucosivorans]MBH5329824.1 DUF4189 domain-containing protein [Eikenella glucosivorans]
MIFSFPARLPENAASTKRTRHLAKQGWFSAKPTANTGLKPFAVFQVAFPPRKPYNAALRQPARPAAFPIIQKGKLMKKFILPALLALGSLAASQFAAANPQEHYCYAMYGNGACVDTSGGGGGYDSGPTRPRVIEHHDFAALAAAPNRVFAVSSGHTAREVRQEALNRCRENGGRNCRVMVTRNGCLATARGKDARGDTLYFFGVGERMRDAENDALNQCKTGGYKECQDFDDGNSFVCASPRR